MWYNRDKLGRQCDHSSSLKGERPPKQWEEEVASGSPLGGLKERCLARPLSTILSKGKEGKGGKRSAI